jgi:hypothetical protein
MDARDKRGHDGEVSDSTPPEHVLANAHPQLFVRLS